MLVHPGYWLAFNAFILVFLALDLGFFHKKSHEVKSKEAFIWTCVWICLSLLFAGIVTMTMSAQNGVEFITAYFIEKSLSLDNLFVIILIFKMYKIPSKYHHRVLFWGILGVIVLRAIMILIGVSLVHSFGFIIYLFGAFLVYAGYKTFTDHHPGEDAPDSKMVTWLENYFPFSKTISGDRFFIKEKGRTLGTPLLMALIVIEISDLMFAVDSIPAVISISKDPFIIYTSNIFAILGLRSMYFLLADILPKFKYLHYALGIILIFVGVKMLVSGYLHITAIVSLFFIFAVFSLSILLSHLLREKKL